MYFSSATAIFAGAMALLGSASAQAAPSCGGSRFELEVERRAQFDVEDYVFDIAGELDSNDGQVAAFNAGVSPALFDTFISSVLLEFEACNINLPHTHPRATEVSLVLEGELMMGFAEENGGQVHEFKLRPGQVMVFPQGVLHYQLNDNCEPAKMYAVLNHHDPGTLSIPVRLNLFDDTALAATYGAKRNLLR